MEYLLKWRQWLRYWGKKKKKKKDFDYLVLRKFIQFLDDNIMQSCWVLVLFLRESWAVWSLQYLAGKQLEK